MNSKKLIIRVVCIVLAVLILALGAVLVILNLNKKPTKKRKVIKKVVVVTEDPVDTPTLPGDFGVVDDPNSEVDDTYEKVRRKLSLKINYEVPEYVPEYAVTESNWAGPEGYVIVASKDVRACRDAALRLKEYFKETTGIELPCVTDDAPEVEKEILVGDTNRRTSTLPTTQFAASLEGEKLVFEGGHFAMVETAVDWFISFDYKEGSVNLLTGEIKDFAPTFTILDRTHNVNKTLNYVWGDEHGGNTMNPQKWCYFQWMGGMPDVLYVRGEPYISVNEGQLKITSGRYYNLYDTTKQYQTNVSITSKNQMSFVMGYVEFRARVPYEKGSWPSYWFPSKDSLHSTYDQYSCFIEIDFLESLDRKYNHPNLHKWYKKDSIRAAQTGSTHTSWGMFTLNRPIKGNVFENPDTVSNEYHIYGMYWTADEMSFYMDNEWYWSFDLTYNFDGIDYDGDADKHFTDMPVYPVINNSIATPKSEQSSYAVDNKHFPFEYFIDYSRYYQEQGVGQLYFAEENYH